MLAIDPRSFQAAHDSHLGQVRAAQEDCCDAFEHPSGARLFVVADGMGGHRGGATASRLTVEAMGEALHAGVDDPGNWLAEAFRSANARVHREALEDPELRGMGTTAVVFLVDANANAWLGHVGDSRAYRLRNEKLERLTEDHSVVAEMVRRGLLTEPEAERHPRRNEILRSVGVEAEVIPELRKIDLEPGDRLLLCSDGLSGMVDDDGIAKGLASGEPAQAVQALIDAANAGGGTDNITAQIVAIPDAEDTSHAADESGTAAAILPLAVLVSLVGAAAVFAWTVWR